MTVPDTAVPSTGRPPSTAPTACALPEVPGGAAVRRSAVSKPSSPSRGWWPRWRARFGIAEACGTIGAIAGFAAGYLAVGSLLSASALSTVCEVVLFYGCVGVKTALAASRATAHLAGWRRLAAGTWNAVTEQLASCAVAEAVDDLFIRPCCLAGAAWLLRPLPGGVWLGFAVGKAAADVAWYGMEASARWSVMKSVTARQVAPTPEINPDLPRIAGRPEPGRAGRNGLGGEAVLVQDSYERSDVCAESERGARVGVKLRPGPAALT